MNAVAATLRARVRLLPDQVRAVRPGEQGFGEKLEPEGIGIVRTAFKAHIILGLAGLLVGFIAWLWFYLSGVVAIVSSPGLSVGAFLFFGTILGMLLGGLVTARPDHDLVVQHVRTASETGQWSLVIHPLTPAECDASLSVLAEADVESVRSV
jgi:hypothetical protein